MISCKVLSLVTPFLPPMACSVNEPRTDPTKLQASVTRIADKTACGATGAVPAAIITAPFIMLKIDVQAGNRTRFTWEGFKQQAKLNAIYEFFRRGGKFFVVSSLGEIAPKGRPTTLAEEVTKGAISGFVIDVALIEKEAKMKLEQLKKPTDNLSPHIKRNWLNSGLRSAIFNAAFFGFYPFVKTSLGTTTQNTSAPDWVKKGINTFGASLVAGATGTVFSQPFDFAGTRSLKEEITPYQALRNATLREMWGKGLGLRIIRFSILVGVTHEVAGLIDSVLKKVRGKE